MAKYDPQYMKEGDWLVHKYVEATGDTLKFQARDIRRDRTGVHASVIVSYNGFGLGNDVFNVERDAARTHLLNASLKRLKQRGYKLEMPDADVDHAFDLFCYGLWEQQVGALKGKRMKGDPTIKVAQLVRGLVVEGGGTAIFAPPGRGKTYTLLTLSVCIDAGLSVPGVLEVAKSEPVLFINLERSESSMLYRLGCVNRALGLPEDRELLFINARGQSLKDIYQAARETMSEHGCKVVAVDSLSRIGSGSMVDDEDANNAMDMLNRLAPTWLLSAHTPRQDENHMFGSQMYDAAVDVAVRLNSQQKDNLTGVGLTVTKENDLGPQPLRVLAFEFGSGLKVVRRGYPSEFPEVEGEGKRKVNLLEDIIQFLLEEAWSTAEEVAAELGRDRSTVSRTLNLEANQHLFVWRREGKTRRYAVRTK